jgi:heme exporter protein A
VAPEGKPDPGRAPSPAVFLEARELSRSFGPVRAVDGISFFLSEGDVLTVLGPNGAGKTTLLGMLGGALRPDSGTILLRGEPRNPAETAWRREIGVLSHRTFLYGALSARENLAFYGRLYGVGGLAERVEEGLAEVGLVGQGDRPVRGFSRGMRQRLALARTLLHSPALVLLDEPFTGLDLHAAALLRDVLLRLRDGRRTVVLVTHNLLEGLALADRVAIQDRGRFAFLGARTEIPAGGEERFYRSVVEGPGGEGEVDARVVDAGPGMDMGRTGA